MTAQDASTSVAAWRFGSASWSKRPILASIAAILGIVVLESLLVQVLSFMVTAGSLAWRNPEAAGPNVVYFTGTWVAAVTAYSIACWLPAGRRRNYGLLGAVALAVAVFPGTSGPLMGREAVVTAVAWAAAAPRVSWRYGVALVLLTFAHGMTYAATWGSTILSWSAAAAIVVLAVGFGAKALWHWSKIRASKPPGRPSDLPSDG